MKWDNKIHFHTDACSHGNMNLHVACANDGMIYFARQSTGGSVRDATFEEHIKTGSFTVFTPPPPRPRLIVGPHEGNRVRVIAYPNGSKPRIIILDGGVRIQYESFDYGFSWKWEGVGAAPAGFIDIAQDEDL
jgi:WD40 repeat protein